MEGYINNPTETENILKKHKDGKMWIHSGDLGYISENGFIHISGRLKRYMLCIKNGVQKKVFSHDIEKELLKHQGVENCAVVPIEDVEVNQVPVAYIIPKANIDKVKLEIELGILCGSNLVDVYRTVRYIFVDSFPRTKVGKVDYLTLEQQAK